MFVKIFTDGAARGNPEGPGGYGTVLQYIDSKGELQNSGDTAALAEWSAPIQARRHSTRVHNPAVEKRLAAITAQDSQRANVYEMIVSIAIAVLPV